MLEVGHMAIHVAQMESIAHRQRIFDIVTYGNARSIGLKNYGFDTGFTADFVILQARDQVEALLLKANCLVVIRHGRVIAETVPHSTRLKFEGRPGRALLRALLFALFDAYQLRLQPLVKDVPYQLFLMVPHVLSIIALVVMARRARVPRALMQPFRRGER